MARSASAATSIRPRPTRPFRWPCRWSFTNEDGPAHELLAEFDGRTARFEAVLPAAPVRIAVDPGFDTFRRLLPQESPVALSNLFGAEAGLMLLPARAPQALLEGYRALAAAWQQGHPRWQISNDDAIDRLPDDLPVWLFGWENRFIDELTAAGSGFAARYRAAIDRAGGQPARGHQCRTDRPSRRTAAGLGGHHRGGGAAGPSAQAAPLRQVWLSAVHGQRAGQPTEGTVASRRLAADALVYRRAPGAEPAAAPALGNGLDLL